mmetsp:Transcript_28734/g.43427  ORF Transcript_28734/g.43427 Transcript_28734/m.43427 type:complete len:183 (+) Transcript_28734:155-703(+)
MYFFQDVYSAPRGENPGKSGGGFALSKDECFLVRVQVEAELGPIYCGGPIGRGGNKICFRKDCSVSSHKLKPKPEGFPEDNMVFICSPGGDVIYSKPAVPASRFGDNIERYLGEAHTKESWATLLMTIENSDGTLALADINQLSDRLVNWDRILPQGMTPLKKKPKLEISSPALWRWDSKSP